ncbi:PDR/VanB family oxidoreductase [Streptomyces fuscichromogenes]|uniref:Ferredoxin n=1 Tax=Streptomyces fuscichromogenes TaxID=1324013 RepID=A0A917X8I4_9ACTN|nr:PDR/VanB family oxidoreductase [Streptomyces fuscichromogenes]GGM97228.1 ferredoxin [Streptomyces fuscichromogenes]
MGAEAGQTHRVRVTALRWEADGVCSLELRPVDSTELPGWRAGSHATFRLGNGTERSYSLCSDPGVRTAWRVAVLRQPSGRGGSRWIHEQVRPGDVLTVTVPRNNFPFVPGTERTLFVAGGIGITPLLPMIREARAAGVPWRLLYLGRSLDRMAFVDDPLLDGPVDIVPEDRDGRADLGDWLGPVTDSTAVYACGPAELLDALDEMSADWPVGTLRVERFQPRAPAAPASAEAFEVECGRSGVTVSVDPETTILAALQQAGVKVPSSCLEGICGTCETPVVSGEPEHRDSVLSAEERAAGETVLVCVSRARTPRLVLDV